MTLFDNQASFISFSRKKDFRNKKLFVFDGLPPLAYRRQMVNSPVRQTSSVSDIRADHLGAQQGVTSLKGFLFFFLAEILVSNFSCKDDRFHVLNNIAMRLHCSFSCELEENVLLVCPVLSARLRAGMVGGLLSCVWPLTGVQCA